MPNPLDTPKALSHPAGARALALGVALALAFALTLSVAATKAQAQDTSATTSQGPAGSPGKTIESKASMYAARRVTSRHSRRRHKKPVAPTPALQPSPAPESNPAPGTSPTSTPSTEPSPAPAPESTPTQAPLPSGVLFRGNFDVGFKGWYVQSLSTRATLFGTGAFQGAQAARFEVRQGDVEPDTGSQRSEVSGPTFEEGQDLYIRDAIRVPSSNSYSAPWQIIQQLHEENWSGSPGMAVFLDNKRALKLGAGDGSPTFWQGPSLQPDRWYDLVYRVKLAQGSSAGFVEVWLDGVQQAMANGQTRIYGQTIQTTETYLKAGIYRSKSSTGTSVVEHDAIVVGTSLGAVTN